jgi:hypothetical protein
MKHELRIESKFAGQAKGGGVVGDIVGKLGTQTDQAPIEPPQHVRDVIVRLVNGHTGRQDGRRFLIETSSDGRLGHGVSFGQRIVLVNNGGIIPRTGNCRTAQTPFAGTVQILGKELNVPAFAFGDVT